MGHIESLWESYGYGFITPAYGSRDLTLHPPLSSARASKRWQQASSLRFATLFISPLLKRRRRVFLCLNPVIQPISVIICA